MVANIHPVTGIAYGIINANNLDSEVLNSISFINGIDMDYVNAQVEWATPQGFVVPESKPTDSTYQYYKRLQDALNQFDADWYTFEREHEEFTGTSFCADYEGVSTIYNTDYNTVMVLESPETAMVNVCSPCVPNAGDLDTPNADGIQAYTVPFTWKYSID